MSINQNTKDKMNIVRDYVSRIIEADSLDQVNQLFIKAINYLNFSHVYYGFVFEDVLSGGLYVTYGNYETDFYSNYIRLGGLKVDITTAKIFYKNTILIWESDEYLTLFNDNADLIKPMKKLEQYCYEIGAIHGATISFRVRPNLVFSCGVCTRGMKKKTFFVQKAKPNLKLASLLCQTLYTKLLGSSFNLLSNSKVVTNYKPLKENELMYLSLKMDGLTDQKIAQHIGKSEKMLQVYNLNIRDSLHTTDFRQALLKAQLLKLDDGF